MKRIVVFIMMLLSLTTITYAQSESDELDEALKGLCVRLASRDLTSVLGQIRELPPFSDNSESHHAKLSELHRDIMKLKSSDTSTCPTDFNHQFHYTVGVSAYFIDKRLRFIRLGTESGVTEDSYSALGKQFYEALEILDNIALKYYDG